MSVAARTSLLVSVDAQGVVIIDKALPASDLVEPVELGRDTGFSSSNEHCY